MSEPLLQIRNLKMHFPIHAGFFRRVTGTVRAVDDISFDIHTGETLGLVGESGCGKSTVARTIMRAYEPTAGAMTFRDGDTAQDLATLPEDEMARVRPRIRMIFQDPYSSLNPRMTVQDLIGEPIRNLQPQLPRAERERKVQDLLRRVGLRPEYASRYPHAFSGGERQRIVIARALALDPRLVIADEAVSALDVSVRAQILNLLQQLQRDFDLTYLFIGHDLSVVEHICDRVAVMYVGKIVELAATDALFARPRHPYTEALLSAVPNPDPDLRDPGRQIVLEGDVPDPANPPPGCHFHPRCRYAQDRCRVEVPPLREVDAGRLAACHFAETLTLRGTGTLVEIAS